MVHAYRGTPIGKKAKSIFFSFGLAVMILLASVNIIKQGDTTDTTGWGYRIKITFNNTASAINLISFPVLVSLNASHLDFWNHVNANYSDIRFIDDDDITELFFEMEQWDYGDKQAVMWVNIPQIDAGSTTDYIYLYYGNTYASPSLYESSTQVWNSHYRGVWHFNETTGMIHDSTGNGHVGNPQGYPTYGAIGISNGGIGLDGVDDCIDYGPIFSDTGTGQTLTMEAWFQLDNTTSDQVILGKNNGTTLPFGIQLFPNSNHIYIFGGDTTNGYRSHMFTWTPDTQWHYLVGIINGSIIEAYLDGVSQGTSMRNNENILNNTADFIIGGQNITGIERYLNGSVDEIRISSAPFTEHWVYASFKTSQNSFVTLGSAEDIVPPSIQDVCDSPDPQYVLGPVNITAKVTDNQCLNKVKVHITYPDTSTANMTMAQYHMTDIYYFNTTYTPIGIYTYHIWANDTQGNGQASLLYNFTIELPLPAIDVEKTIKDGTSWDDNMTTFLGDNVEFQIMVSNTGSTTLSHVTITDTLPIFLRYNYDANPIPSMESHNYIAWNLGSLDTGDSKIITYTAHVIDTGNGQNVVSAACDEGVNDTDMVLLTSLIDGDDTTPPLVNIDKPSRYLYIADRAIMPTLRRPIILGGITLEAIAMDDESGIDRVEFLINNNLKSFDESWPYEWFWDELSFGLYTLKAKAYNNVGNTDVDTIDIYIINF